MRRYIGILVVASVVLMAGFVAPQEPAPSQTPPDRLNNMDFAPGRILVKIKDNAPADAIVPLDRSTGARLEDRIPQLRVSVVDLPKDLTVPEAIDRYEASPAVEYVEPDYELHPAVLPDDPKYPKMYELNNRGQTGGMVDADLDAPDAWNVTTGSAETVVAVIDTGMDITHPDLDDNVWTNPDEVPDNGIDDDRNGYVDDVHGWDFHDDYVVSRDRGTEVYGGGASVFDGAQQDLHGTIAAGPIAAEGNNGTGVTGINWQVKVAPLKIIGPDGVVHVTDAINAIDYAVKEDINISSNSWGGGDYSQALFDAINRAGEQGHLFVAAAGNGNEDWVGDDNDTRPFYPASYDTPSNNVISVAASNDTDALTSFSNYGLESVDLAAPGRDIPCPVPGGSYSVCWGTSIATPHVSGVAALVESQFPQLTPAEVRTRILESVDKKASLEGKVASGGRVNAAKALGANTSPVILGQKPGSRVRASRTLIRATVRDDETDLTKDQIALYLDGRQIFGFSYDQDTNRLTYKTRKLASHRHHVRIVAHDVAADPNEPTLDETRTWSFKVIRRR